MRLYLHIGTEKTGSSYLQTLLANNREQLLQAKIHYPVSTGMEEQMLRGDISYGNGQELFEAIRYKNKEKLRHLLAGFHKQAEDKACEISLISNELIFSALQSQEQWTVFRDLYKEAGFDELKMLLVLRNPAEQALSLYKHRAKGGTTPEIDKWIKTGYSLHRDLENFFAVLKYNYLACTVRKYKKDSDYMDRILFINWLELDLPKTPVKRSVNPSLSLSELSLLRKINAYGPSLKDELYQRFLQLPKSEKAVETNRERHYLNSINHNLSAYKSIWETCNTHLPADEPIEIPAYVERENPIKDENLIFSENQAAVIAGLLSDSLKGKFRRKLRYLEARRKLGKLKNKLFS